MMNFIRIRARKNGVSLLALALATMMSAQPAEAGIKDKLAELGGKLKGFSIKSVKIPVKTGKITLLALKHLALFSVGTAVIVKDQTVEGAKWTGLEFLSHAFDLKNEIRDMD